MKHTTAPGQTPGTAQSVEPTGETTKNRVLSRLKLALIQDERADRGYNPYDAASARLRDVWRSKPKRA
ncbi:MAG TPA: hypothetical protein VJQ47_12945 [Steroidobacteraceae bacterium]|nr:hypothetical protein [Steroidobacteraceae bacterium]